MISHTTTVDMKTKIVHFPVCDLHYTRAATLACMHSLAMNSRVRTEISLVRIHTSLPYYNLGVTKESPN
eukprot:COSAG02_NODE_1924_length_10351_cov_4.487320_11_plen_69_part_00